jgi:putative DNA methylase
MTSPFRKKLIEVSIPLEAINKASAREKSIRHGHPSTLHLWWARRPLAACRAVLFAQLVDDPSGWPDRFPTEADQEVERKRLHKVIEDLVPWEASNNETILNAARWEIARSVAWGLGEEPPARGDGPAILDYLQTKAPPVYDPFSGGGSIPLEAQRLGLRAYGSDLNPVAVLIGKALVEIPPKFAGRPPVNPKSRQEARHGEVRGWKGAQGLADDVRYYGQWMRDEAKRRIGHLYPEVELPDGGKATVIAWLWARTVRSPDPAAKGAMVPLVSSFLLSAKEGRKTWVEPVLNAAAPNGYEFTIHSGPLGKADEERLRRGTKSAKGQAFICVLTGSVIERAYIQSEGKADRLDQKMMAVVAEGSRTRVYIAATSEQELLARSVDGDAVVADAKETFLSDSTPTRAMITGGVCSAYGLRTWGHLFTSRQLIALTTISGLVVEARTKCLEDAHKNECDDNIRLSDGGVGPAAYADAVATYLAFTVDKLADLGNSLVRWEPVAQCPRQLFGRQGMAMIWDFAEANIFSSSSGGFQVLYEGQAQAMHVALSWCYPNAICEINNFDATKNSYPVRPVVVSTDPPYYDNIGYAVLSDFFYVWMKRSLCGIWPDLFRRLSTPKDDELVATPYRHGGQDQAEAFFMAGMGEAMSVMRKATTVGEPLAIYYAFKQAEAAAEGITSAGWASFLQAVVDAGLTVDGTWPMRTENASRLVSQGTNALASSIVLICRPHDSTAAVATRADFLRALRRDLPEAIEAIRKAGVGPVDMQQSVIGPGMGVFTRFARVLEDDDSAMPVKTALSLINRVWADIENELDTAFDAETQVALAWFATYGFDAKPSGELITLANAKNIPLDTLFATGVFQDLHGKAGLTARVDLPRGWSPRTDATVTVWECVQHTARVLAAADGGATAAAALVAQMTASQAEGARALAYRLFEIATQKGWSTEALVYNELAQEWPHLEELVTTNVAAGPAPPAQRVMDL